MRSLDRTHCLLFVYGSLKRGGANHQQLDAAEYVAKARTAARFGLRVIDGYPALVAGSRRIVGELYRILVGSLPVLDEFEGSGYVRQEIELDGREPALAYLSRAPGAGVPYSGDEWPMLPD